MQILKADFKNFVTLSQFYRNCVVSKISQPINLRYVDLNHDLNQLQCSVSEPAPSGGTHHCSPIVCFHYVS